VSDHGEIDVNQLIDELDDAYTYFPEDTLRACQQHRELVIPRLIDVLREAAELGRDGTEREGNTPFFALYLLAEFQAGEALPAIIDFLSLPNDIPDALLGEVITHDLPRLLATFTADRLEILDALIRNPRINKFVRWAAVDAFDYFLRDGRLSREDVISRLLSQLRESLACNDTEIVSPLVYALTDLGAAEARNDIQVAFERRLLDEDYGSMDSIDALLRLDPTELANKLERLPPTKIDDTVEAMRGWNWPDQDWVDKGQVDGEWPVDEWDDSTVDGGRTEDDDLGTAGWDDDGSYEPTHSATIRHESPRVGRNDPCPCGSGKKYKKCCLRHAEES
jgi:hypothetical protein